MNYTEKQIKYLEENCKNYSECEMYKLYDEMLDDCNEDVEIAGSMYSTSTARKNVDETAYNCGFADFSSNQFLEIGIFWYREDDVEECLAELEALEEEEKGDE